MSDSAVVQIAPERAFKDSERSSTISSGTHVPLPADLDQPQPLADSGDALELDNKKPDNVLHGGEGESAFPEDKRVCTAHLALMVAVRNSRNECGSAPQEEVLENAEDDWTHDPINPRNWSSGKKWIMVAIVRFVPSRAPPQWKYLS